MKKYLIIFVLIFSLTITHIYSEEPNNKNLIEEPQVEKEEEPTIKRRRADRNERKGRVINIYSFWL